MEQINSIELNDERIFPDENVLKKVLGSSFAVYCSLIELFHKNEMNIEWKYYKDGKAWLCKVQKLKMTIVWMSAWKEYMKATIYIPAKYAEKLQKLDISEETKQRILETKCIGKSKPCMFEMRDNDIVKDFRTVMEYKINNK